MIKITSEIALKLLEVKGIGYYCFMGAVGTDEEFTVVVKDLMYYLAHKSEFDNDGVFTRLKNEKLM